MATSTRTRSKAASSKVDKSVVFYAEFEKETPGTNRYKEEGDKDNHNVGTVYLKKGPCEKKLDNPGRIKVTVEAVEDDE